MPERVRGAAHASDSGPIRKLINHLIEAIWGEVFPAVIQKHLGIIRSLIVAILAQPFMEQLAALCSERYFAFLVSLACHTNISLTSHDMDVLTSQGTQFSSADARIDQHRQNGLISMHKQGGCLFLAGQKQCFDLLSRKNLDDLLLNFRHCQILWNRARKIILWIGRAPVEKRPDGSGMAIHGVRGEQCARCLTGDCSQFTQVSGYMGRPKIRKLKSVCVTPERKPSYSFPVPKLCAI